MGCVMIRTMLLAGTITTGVAFIVGFAVGWKVTLLTIETLDRRKKLADANSALH
jgi:hypothetical protein